MSTDPTDAPSGARDVDAFLAGLDNVLATTAQVETRHDTKHDTTPDTTRHQVPDRTRQGTTHRDTRHGAGRVLTLHRPLQGPRPIDELLATEHDTTHDDTTDDTPSATDTTKTRAARRALRKDTAQRATTTNDDTPAEEDDTEEKEDDTDTDTEHDATEQDTRSLGQRLIGLLTKAQQVATDSAEQIATNIRHDTPESAAGQERVARALDDLTAALQPVEPDRTWMPSWLGTVGTTLLFNLAAAAAGHYTAALAGYPDLSPAVIVYDLISPTTQGAYHWSTGLIFGAIPPLTCWLLIDRRARTWGSTILRWLARIPLATTTAGTLAATWHIIVHLATGATS